MGELVCASLLAVAFVNWFRIHLQICEVTDVVHVDLDDIDVGWVDYGILLWSAGEEIDGTSERELADRF